MEMPKVGSAVIVENDGKILLGLRNKENAYGFWVIPGGGVEFGETIHDAAIREIKEETNLDIEILKLVCFKEVINLPEKYHTVVFFHLAKPKNMNIIPGGDLSEARFFSIDEIKRLKTVESVEWALREAGLWE